MKNFFKNIQNILIVSLVVIILWLQNCSGGGGGVVNPEPTIITEVTTLYDTITDTIPEYVPQWGTKIETRFITDTFYQHVDTPEILKDYYTRYIYADTIKIDTIGYLVVNDSVSRNQIYSRKIYQNILLPTTTIKQTTYINRRELYMGLKIQGRTDQLNYVGGELLFKTKKNKVYSIGVGLNQEFQPIISGGMFFKIGK